MFIQNFGPMWFIFTIKIRIMLSNYSSFTVFSCEMLAAFHVFEVSQENLQKIYLKTQNEYLLFVNKNDDAFRYN